MPIEALWFTQAAKPARISLATPLTAESVPVTKTPVAVVVLDSELGDFQKCSTVFKDRGRKDERKGLPSLLLGYGGLIPVIDGGYGDSGRLRQGVAALLKKAAAVGECKAYVIGATEKIFHTVGGSAKDIKPPRPVTSGPARALSSLEEWPVPIELAKRFMGEAREYQSVLQLILRAKDNELPVLILGETGTGKSVIARAIHDFGQKPEERFVEVNCGAIPSELLEAELFGYEPRAFTGANLSKPKIGLWEFAGHGTLFLDEIGELTLNHQVKILLALQGRRIRRVGGVREIPVDARVIAATNRNLYGMVLAGQFRLDLYFRLRNFVIYTPSLRSDPSNIALLAKAKWKKLRGDQASLNDDVLKELCAMRWPGNVRELYSFLESLNSIYRTDNLRVEHLTELQRYYSVPDAGSGAEADDPVYHRIECLRHLRRADEVVHACEQQLKLLADGQPLSELQRSILLTQGRAQLQILLAHRLYFHSQETYDAVAQVDSDLDHLLLLPEHDARPQTRFWNSTLAPHLHQAIGRLFTEVEQLTGEKVSGSKAGAS
jgi:transcriptional regulator with AAA-type ATPase domain